jgi:predicted flap endonuclease-1-like 5' DNA nuclease
LGDHLAMTSINEIQGIDDAVAERLRAEGVTTVESFLERTATPSGRSALARSTSIDPVQILTWTNQADLFRIKGVAGHFAELLEAAGVDSVPELAQRDPERLRTKLAEVNDRREVVHALPHDHDVEHWVEQAKQLPKVVLHKEPAATGSPAGSNGAAARPAAERASAPPVDIDLGAPPAASAPAAKQAGIAAAVGLAVLGFLVLVLLRRRRRRG